MHSTQYFVWGCGLENRGQKSSLPVTLSFLKKRNRWKSLFWQGVSELAAWGTRGFCVTHVSHLRSSHPEDILNPPRCHLELWQGSVCHGLCQEPGLFPKDWPSAVLSWSKSPLSTTRRNQPKGGREPQKPPHQPLSLYGAWQLADSSPEIFTKPECFFLLRKTQRMLLLHEAEDFRQGTSLMTVFTTLGK